MTASAGRVSSEESATLPSPSPEGLKPNRFIPTAAAQIQLKHNVSDHERALLPSCRSAADAILMSTNDLWNVPSVKLNLHRW